ncbi:MAG: hypothetical protein J1E98_06560 [Lachnospiraceae bacterium]|nr:hypothetical protein [Lachnospiraceae bacterium]
MIALKINNIKQFMGKLLASETFDVFMLEEASISTYNTFIIDGHQNRDFYSTEEWEDKELRPYDFSMWKQVRPICYSLIKGTKTPGAFKFILHLIPEQVHNILEKSDTDVTFDQLKALVLTIKYDGTSLTLITGTAFHSFVMDKSVDGLWDDAVRKFLYKCEIEYEEL